MNTERKNDFDEGFSHAHNSEEEVLLNKFSFTTELEEKLSMILLRVGIVPNVKGYRYLRKAVTFAVCDMELVEGITKKLYPKIAAYFGTSTSRVERAIRHAIATATDSGKMQNINLLFGINIFGKNERPTNSEFIALVADKMIIELMETKE